MNEIKSYTRDINLELLFENIKFDIDLNKKELFSKRLEKNAKNDEKLKKDLLSSLNEIIDKNFNGGK